jgi:DNA-binding transcriptional LysR family regulator
MFKQSVQFKLESLYFFVVLAESDSFLQASERLYMSQQALSKALAQLEEDLGQTLIYRHPSRRQRLTPAGEVLLRQCEGLLSTVYRLESGLPQQPEVVPNVVHLGCLLEVDDAINFLLHQTHEQSQGPIIRLKGFLDASAAQLEQALLNQQLDLGVLCHPPSVQGLEYVLLKSRPYIIVGNDSFSGRWDQLPYIRIENCFGDNPLNVWPEQEWPRQVVCEADLAMAVYLCAQGVGCLHIPDDFAPFKSSIFPMGHHIQQVTEAPFESTYRRYLVWSAQGLSEPARQAKQAILQYMGLEA